MCSCRYGFLGGNQCNGTNVIGQRNYPCDSIVVTYWGGEPSQLDAVGRDAFIAQLFKCLVGSALIVKGYVEQHRATNTFGLMVWQLNEIWPTGQRGNATHRIAWRAPSAALSPLSLSVVFSFLLLSRHVGTPSHCSCSLSVSGRTAGGWGSLEYSNGRYSGQVEGGRWKPTHYWLRQHLYRDVMVSCGVAAAGGGGELRCYVKLDAWSPSSVHYTVLVEQFELADARQQRRLELTVALPPGPGSIHWFTLNSSWSSRSSILELSVLSEGGVQPHATNFFLPAPPFRLALTPGALDVAVRVGEPGAGDEEVPIAVTKGSNAVALFFTLTTRAAGRFSRNCFHLHSRAGERLNVTFIPFGALNRTLLEQSLRWEHANLRTVTVSPSSISAALKMDARKLHTARTVTSSMRRATQYQAV